MIRKFKKCLITGSTGSGGSYMIEHILENNNNIKIYGFYKSKKYYTFLKKKYKNRINFFKLNLLNKNKLSKILIKINPDLIYHFASDADVRKSFDKPYEIIINNTLSTLNLFESLRIGSSKALIILCSTSEVYGVVSRKDVPIKESQLFNPASPYAVSKSFQDLLAQMYYRCYGLKIIITRMFSYTNARRDNLFQSAFAKQISDIEKGKKKYLKHGNLNSVRTFMDISDAMNAYWLCALYGKIGEIYNIGGNHILSVKKFLKLLIKNSNSYIKTKLDKKLLRKVDVTMQIPDVKKFKKDTGWKQKISLNESIIKLLNYYR